MRDSDRQHVHEIESALNGAETGRDKEVIDSWRRCIDTHKLDPSRRDNACIVSETRLKEHRQESEDLIHIARGGLDTLFRQVATQQYVVLMADRYGVTVDHFGDSRFERELQHAGLHMGACWLEEQSGTSGVGACLQAGEAVTIHQNDHFGLTHTPLSCTAAPIYNTTGTLAAVLDISLLRSPRPKSSQRLAMQLVSASARRVELANLMARSTLQWVLRFSLSPELLDIDPEAAISLDDGGRIIGFSNGAARMLAAVADIDWRQPDALLGRSVTRFFNMQVDDLPRYLRGRPASDRILQLVDGSLVFAHAIAPQPVLPSPSPAIPVRRDSLAHLHGGDEKWEKILKTVHRLIQSAVPVLFQGESGCDRRSLARALHNGRTPRQPFRVIDCVGLTAQMLQQGDWQAEFSADKGSPVGRSLNGGTLFFENLNDLGVEAQDALQRFLAELERGGSSEDRWKTPPRLMSSAHPSLQKRVAEGSFRIDLFHRLGGAVLDVPPLRERQDIDWLLDRELGAHCQTDPPAYRFSQSAREALQRHDWPGNLRELGNVIEVAIALSTDGRIDVSHLPSLTPESPGAQNLAAKSRSPDRLKQLLDAHHWNISRVARELGVDRTTVHRRIRRAGLQRPVL